MRHLRDTEKQAIYNEWISGKYTLHHLAASFRVSEATVSNIVTKYLKQKDSSKCRQNK